MSRSYREIDADRLQIREGGGGLSLFGLPFLCGGLFMDLAALGIVHVSASGGGSPPWGLLVLLGSIFTTVGAGLVFGRAWTTVDASRREVVKEWGLLWPIRRTTHPVDDRAVISIGHQSGDSDSAEQFPIVLRTEAGTVVKVGSFTDYATSRSCAVAVATRLGLDLEDATTDHRSRVSADRADVPFVERARLQQEREQSASPPPTLRSSLTSESNGIRISIPNPPLQPIVAAAMIGSLAIPLVVVVVPLSRFFRQTRTPDPVGAMFVGFLIFGFGVLPALVALSVWLRSRFGRTIVTASIDGLVVEERGVFRVKSHTVIAADDIVDIDFGTRESALASARVATEETIRESNRFRSASPEVGKRTERVVAMLSGFVKGRGITVKTMHGLTNFGEGLADEEIEYINDAIRRALIR